MIQLFQDCIEKLGSCAICRHHFASSKARQLDYLDDDRKWQMEANSICEGDICQDCLARRIAQAAVCSLVLGLFCRFLQGVKLGDWEIEVYNLRKDSSWPARCDF